VGISSDRERIWSAGQRSPRPTKEHKGKKQTNKQKEEEEETKRKKP
jgi:hypothetical protein